MSSRERARVIAFFVMALVMFVGPAYGHFFAKGRLEHVGWRMFRVRALDFCAVQYVTRDAGGDTPVDRFEVLGLRGESADEPEPPDDVFLIETPERAYAIGAEMCARLGPGTDLRVDLRCARVDGWERIEQSERNLCEAP